MPDAMANQEAFNAGPVSRDLAVRVGLRIRRLRVAASVSLTRLATESGLGKGTLSELENGKRNPTLETLFAIATALDLPLSALLVDDTSLTQAADPATGPSVHARLLMHYEADEARFEMYDLRVAPAMQTSHAHRPGVRETFTVLEGEVTVGPTADPVRLRAGESATYPGDVEHLYRAEMGEAIALVLMSYPRSGHGS